MVWRVPMLSVPDIHTSAIRTKEVVARYEAVRLFVDRAGAADPSFQLTDKNSSAVAQICHRLDGIPLAIELAAARVTVLSIDQILARLENRFHLLTGGSRTALPRQQTLRAAVDWSYELLPPEERTLLNRLSVFAGGLDLEAAEQVCAGDGLKGSDVLDHISRLVDKSLLNPTEAPDGTARYGLLETIRAYGREKLKSANEDATLLSRHAAYYSKLAGTAEPELQGPKQAVWFERLERDHDDLRQAIRGMIERREAGAALRLTGSLWRFWWVRGNWEEGRGRLSAALALEPPSARPSAERTKALHGAGVLAFGQGDFKAAEELFSASLGTGRELGDKEGIALSLFSLGNIANVHEDLAKARSLYEESLALRREVDDRQGMSHTLHNLGVVAQAQGDNASARALYEEALAVHQEIGNVYMQAASLNGLGEVAMQQGDLALARSCNERSLVIQRVLVDKRGIAFSLRGLGNVAVLQGDLGAAKSLLSEALEILSELGDREGLAAALESAAGL